MNDVKHHETSIVWCTQLKHTFLNSSQSHPISVKFEKSGEFHHFIVFDAREFFSRITAAYSNGKQSEHIFEAELEATHKWSKFKQ